MNDKQAVIENTRQHIESMGLPAADVHALEIHYKLVQHIQQLIRDNQGWISFQDYMQQALYASGLGYYVAGAKKLGEQGDFITAPETGTLFARCMANAVGEVFAVLDEVNTADDGQEANAEKSILELGPGSGQLCFHLLQALDACDSLPEHYYLLELSPDLQQRQRELLDQLPHQLRKRVTWLQQWPESLVGVVLGNEVLDAFPVRQFVCRDAAVFERGVSLVGQEFTWAEREADSELTAAVQQIQHDVAVSAGRDFAGSDNANIARNAGQVFVSGYESEWSPAVAPWLRALGDSLRRGMVLLIDYGYPRQEYYLPERTGGTLMCYYQHHAHADPLIMAGLQDITCHVDFTQVARAALECGFSLTGFTNQSNFLLGCGLDQMLQEYQEHGTKAYLQQVQIAKQLIMPGEMGEKFKVLGLAKGLTFAQETRIGGFKIRDFSHRLITAN